MCCLKIDTETLLANCLNTCKTYSFSPDDLQQIVRLMANTTDRYIFSDTGDDALHEIVTKFPDMFVYADEDRIALRSEWQHDDKKLPMAYFDFGYSAADIKQWLDKYYPEEIKTIYGTSIPEQKTNTMKQLAGIYSIKAEDILFIDNKYDTVAQAIKSGITGMTTVEVMAKKCEERRWGGHTTDEV